MQTNNMPRGYGGKPAAQLLTEKPVYLCGKVTGNPHAPYEFRDAKITLRQLGWKPDDIYNPVEIVLKCGLCGAPHGDIMQFLEPYLLKSGTLCRLPRWEQSQGARREYLMASKHGLVIADLLPESGQLKLAADYMTGMEKED